MLDQYFTAKSKLVNTFFGQFALPFADGLRTSQRAGQRTARRLAPDPSGPPDGENPRPARRQLGRPPELRAARGSPHHAEYRSLKP